MKSKIFGVLALVSLVLAIVIFGLFAGTYLVFCGLLMLFISAMYACACIESIPNYDEIAKRITNFFTED